MEDSQTSPHSPNSSLSPKKTFSGIPGSHSALLGLVGEKDKSSPPDGTAVPANESTAKPTMVSVANPRPNAPNRSPLRSSFGNDSSTAPSSSTVATAEESDPFLSSLSNWDSNVLDLRLSNYSASTLTPSSLERQGAVGRIGSLRKSRESDRGSLRKVSMQGLRKLWRSSSRGS